MAEGMGAYMAEKAKGLEALLAEARAAGWRVAVHNDYEQHGRRLTFWLFTHPAGIWAKGEGYDDVGAVAAAVLQMKERFSVPWPGQQQGAING